MRNTENTTHRHPLCFSHTRQKLFCITAKTADNRQQQKAINRNKDREHAIPLLNYEIILNRQ